MSCLPCASSASICSTYCIHATTEHPQQDAKLTLSFFRLSIRPFSSNDRYVNIHSSSASLDFHWLHRCYAITTRNCYAILMKSSPLYLLPLLLFLPLHTAAASVTCYEPVSPSSPLIPITYHDCFQIIKFIVQHDRIERPTLFSRKPHLGYHLPDQWRSGSCVMRLDMNDDAGPDEEETATFKDIVGAAATVMLGCVVPAPHFGGTQCVGAKNVMNVTIFGTTGPALQKLGGLGSLRLGSA